MLNTLLTGTAPQWVAALMLVGIFVRQIVPWRKLNIENATQIRKELHERIEGLKHDHADCIKRVRECEEECARHKQDLQNKLFGMQKQHMQEQISFVRAIIESIPDNPHLTALLKALERGERSVGYIEELGRPIGDAENK